VATLQCFKAETATREEASLSQKPHRGHVPLHHLGFQLLQAEPGQLMILTESIGDYLPHSFPYIVRSIEGTIGDSFNVSRPAILNPGYGGQADERFHSIVLVGKRKIYLSCLQHYHHAINRRDAQAGIVKKETWHHPLHKWKILFYFGS
jgi:hypothetical protein